MPKINTPPKLIKVATYIDQHLNEQINTAMTKLGMHSRAEFIRITLVEKIHQILNQNPKTTETNKQ
jgi:metal-responsive CopG/Arc/MetJ family transcriptional regulator